MARPVLHYCTVALCIIVQLAMGVAPAGSALCLGCRNECDRTQSDVVDECCRVERKHDDCCCQDQPADDCSGVIGRRAADSGCCLTVTLPTGHQRIEPRATVDDRAQVAMPVIAVLPALPLSASPSPRLTRSSLIDTQRAHQMIGLKTIRLVV